VVDDNRDGADSLAELARLHGHTVRTAYSPAAALVALDSFVPDAVLMDLGMPGMDGYQLAREICGRLARRPLLVAVTGHSELARRSQDEGFDEHFLKPVDPAALMAFLAAHAAKRENGRG
jgi:CheY-like chemotaxis protein